MTDDGSSVDCESLENEELVQSRHIQDRSYARCRFGSDARRGCYVGPVPALEANQLSIYLAEYQPGHLKHLSWLDSH